jgi:hypothetical protein
MVNEPGQTASTRCLAAAQEWEVPRNQLMGNEIFRTGNSTVPLSLVGRAR